MSSWYVVFISLIFINWTFTNVLSVSLKLSPSFANVSVIEGDIVNLYCNATPGYFEIQWFKINSQNESTQINTTLPCDISDSNSSCSMCAFGLFRGESGSRIVCRIEDNKSIVESSDGPVLDVLYGPNTPQCTYNGHNLTADITVILGTRLNISCTSDSRPIPDQYIWTYPPGSRRYGQDLTISSVDTGHTGTYRLVAQNSMYPTIYENFSGVTRHNSTSFNVEVLYPPSSPVFRYGNITGANITNNTVTVVRYKSQPVYCVSRANPPVSNYTWIGSENVAFVSGQAFIVNALNETANLTCTAANRMLTTQSEEEKGSGNATLNVVILVPPDNTRIYYQPNCNSTLSMPASSVLKIVEGESFCLECSAYSIPTAVFNWTGAISYVGTVTNIANVTRANAKYINCTAENVMVTSYNGTEVGRQTTVTLMDVLYPPSLPVFRISGVNVSGSITIIQGNSKTISCSSQSNPSPTYIWTPGGTMGYSDLALSSVQHPSGNSRYVCTAETTMRTTTNSTYFRSANATLTVQILFPPSPPTFHYGIDTGPRLTYSLAVVKGEGRPIYCVSEANPPVSSYIWNSYSASQSLDTSSFVSNTSLTCSVTNYMTEMSSNRQYGDARPGQANATIFIVVLTPPTKPHITYLPGCFPVDSLNSPSTLKVVEGNAFCLTCFSTSSPGASYIWSGVSSANEAVLSVLNITRYSEMTAICQAENTMVTSYDGIISRRENSTVNIDVLYGPVVRNIPDQQVVIGKPFELFCTVTYGNPSATTYAWSRHNSLYKLQGQRLYFPSVQRADDGVYTCTASNTLEPTGKQPQLVTDAKGFHLDVLFGAEKLEFYVDNYPEQAVIKVTENSSISMKCYLESNPSSNMTISKDGTEKRTQFNTRYMSLSLVLLCEDAGLYLCTGRNQFQTSPSKLLDIRVLCSPRRTPNVEMSFNISSSLNVNATFRFMTLAFPPPVFKWNKCTNFNCSIEVTSGNKYEVYSQKDTTRLTVIGVIKDDYGKYQLRIENGVGKTLVEYFWLISVENDGQEASSVGAIAGGTVAGILAVALIAGILVRLHLKYNMLTFKKGPKDECNIYEQTCAAQTSDENTQHYERLNMTQRKPTVEDGHSHDYQNFKQLRDGKQLPMQKPKCKAKTNIKTQRRLKDRDNTDTTASHQRDGAIYENATYNH